MIHEIGRELAAELRRQGCPVAVVDGPEPTEQATWGNERIVIEEDLDATDVFGPVVTTHQNPKHTLALTFGAKVTIFAKVTVPGALVFEHRRRARHIGRMVLSALAFVASARKNRFEPKSGKLFVPKDLAATEAAGGAAYELTFGWMHGVPRLTWAGDARPTVAVGPGGVGITSTTKVSQGDRAADDNPNTPPAGAETACGA